MLEKKLPPPYPWKHGPTAQNKHGAHYASLVESDERWKTAYSVWPYQVKFSGYLNFKFFDFGTLPSLNPMRYFCEMHLKNSEI